MIARRIAVLQSSGDDCLPCALAFVTGLPREAIPHFGKFGHPRWWDALYFWLWSWGLDLSPLVDTGDTSGHVMHYGQDSEGHDHVVVFRDGALVYDPNERGTGLAVTQYRWRIVRSKDNLEGE